MKKETNICGRPMCWAQIPHNCTNSSAYALRAIYGFSKMGVRGDTSKLLKVTEPRGRILIHEYV